MLDCKDLGPKKRICVLPVWDEEKQQWVQWHCSEKTYDEINKLCEDYKRRNDTYREPYIILRKKDKGEVEVRM